MADYKSRRRKDELIEQGRAAFGEESLQRNVGRANYVVSVRTKGTTRVTFPPQRYGTNSRVWAKINGSEGSTGWQELSVQLSKPFNLDPFEPGKTDSFEFSASYVGKLQSIEIQKDNGGPWPEWTPCWLEAKRPNPIIPISSPCPAEMQSGWSSCPARPVPPET